MESSKNKNRYISNTQKENKKKQTKGNNEEIKKEKK